MKKLLSLLVALLPMLLVASPISREQAQKSAEAFLLQRGKPAQITSVSGPKKARASKQSVSSHYLFRYDDGIVVTSADDRLPAVLGYSTSGNLCAEAMPLALEEWLNEIDELVSQMPETETDASSAPRRTRAYEQPQDHPSIAPIITAQWYQREPYNLTCPEYLQTGLRSVTGCVATAMTLAMSHYRYPNYTTKAIPKYTYTGNYEGVSTKITVPALPTHLQIDWDNIVDYYDTLHAHTPQQDTAIANLMMYAGKAVKMQYTPSSSGAYSINVASALKDYFGYPSTVIHQQRESFSSHEWDELIYNELANNRPVVYHGSTSSSGHAYIVDGYESNGYYHVNWGWGGSYDGYFLLDVLNPRNNDKTGASSTREGYVQSSGAIIGITTETISPIPARLIMELQRNTADSLFYRSRNYTTCSTHFDIAIAQLDEDGEIIQILDSISDIAYTNTSIKTHGFAINIHTKGTYTIAFVSRISGTEDWLISPNYNNNRALITLIINKNGATVQEQSSQLTILDKNISSTFEVDSLVTIHARIKNTGMATYNGTLYVHSLTCNGYEHRVNPQSVFIESGQTTIVPLGHSPRQWGNYKMYITTAQSLSEGVILDSVDVTIQNPTAGHGLSVIDYAIDNRSENGEIQGNALSGSITVRNVGTAHQSYPLAINLMKKTEPKTYSVVSSQPVNPNRSALAPQEQATYAFSFDSLQLDSIYTIQVVYDSLSTVRPLNGGFYQLFPLSKLTEPYSSKYVAKLTTADTTMFCTSVASALSVAAKQVNPTITLLQTVENISKRLKYASAIDNSVCTLDLNGHTLSGELNYLLLLQSKGENNEFVITDSSISSTGKISSSKSYNGLIRTVYLYYGSLRIEAGTIEAENTLPYSTSATSIGATPVYTRSNTSFEWNGGLLTSISDRNAIGLVNHGATVINDGHLDVNATLTNAYGIYVGAETATNTPTALIKGGYFMVKAPSAPKMVNTHAKADALKIEGGFFNANRNLSYYLAPKAEGKFYARKLSATENGYPDGYRYTIDQATVAVTNNAKNTTAYYTSLREAVAATKKMTSATVKLLDDVTAIDTYILFNSKIENSVITLDLNGHVLQGNASPLLYIKPSSASSQFVITDSSSQQTGKIQADLFSNSSARAVYLYRGSLVLHSGTIEIDNDLSYSEQNSKVAAIGIVTRAQTQFTMLGGRIYAHCAQKAFGIYAYSNVTIQDGLIEVSADNKSAYGIYGKHTEGQQIIISGGKFLVSAPKYFAPLKRNSEKISVVLSGGYYNTKTYLYKFTAPTIDSEYQVVDLDADDELYAEGYRYTVRSVNDDKRAIVGQHNATTDLSEIETDTEQPSTKNQKLLRNGQVLILYGDKVFNANGIQVK